MWFIIAVTIFSRTEKELWQNQGFFSILTLFGKRYMLLALVDFWLSTPLSTRHRPLHWPSCLLNIFAFENDFKIVPKNTLHQFEVDNTITVTGIKEWVISKRVCKFGLYINQIYTRVWIVLVLQYNLLQI